VFTEETEVNVKIIVNYSSEKKPPYSAELKIAWSNCQLHHYTFLQGTHQTTSQGIDTFRSNEPTLDVSMHISGSNITTLNLKQRPIKNSITVQSTLLNFIVNYIT
jgi:hypothetical protein